MHTWGKNDGPGGIRLSFVLSVLGFVVPIAILLLALKPPEQIAVPGLVAPTTARSFQLKVSALEARQVENAPPSEVRLTASEITAALAQSDSSPVAGAPAVSFRGDQVIGQFVTRMAGQQVYITVSGHLGAKDGYVTFDPTSFSIGNLSIPVALVNPALQKKMQEQRDQLKLPTFVGDLRVENGELVITPK